MHRVKIGVLGHYGNHNLGDEAIILATIQNLKKILPEAEFVGISIRPEDTKKRYGIEVFPVRYRHNFFRSNDIPNEENQNRWFLFRKLKGLSNEIKFLKRVSQRLEDIDLLLICGSNQLVDNFGGSRGFPYTLMKWTLLARLRLTKVAFISVGAGPIDHFLSYKMLGTALKQADYLSYRDEGSKKLIESNISNIINGAIYPDLAHSLKTKPESIPLDKDRIIVGINPMPVFDKRYWYKSDEKKYKNYIVELTKFVEYLLQSGIRVHFFNTHPKDLLVIEDIITELDSNDKYLSDQISIKENETVQELMNTLAGVDIVVATRFHATVMPLQIGKPVLGICYHRKSKELLKDVGLDNYYVDVRNFTHQQLKDKFNRLLSELDNEKKKVEHNYQKYTIVMEEQWHRIVKLIESKVRINRSEPKLNRFLKDFKYEDCH